ncbi:MAG: hypothetical protein M3295_04105, partial [Chloroflexota bacterium]|nr:hypothetical protein [Chloroflexota bacterium]
MTISNHPEDDRLAALAGADPESVSDTGLRSHVADCARCRGVVAELTAIHAALAELPDVTPPAGFRAWTAAPEGSAQPRLAFGVQLRPTLRRALAPAILA